MHSIADVVNLFFCAVVGQGALVVESPEGVELLQGLDERLRGRGVEEIPLGGARPRNNRRDDEWLGGTTLRVTDGHEEISGEKYLD